MFVTGYDPYAIPVTAHSRVEETAPCERRDATRHGVPTSVYFRGRRSGRPVRLRMARARARAAYGQDPHSPSYLQITRRTVLSDISTRGSRVYATPYTRRGDEVWRHDHE